MRRAETVLSTVPIGSLHELNTSTLRAACPSRKYQRCFARELEARYPVTQFRLPRMHIRCESGRGSLPLMDDAQCTLPPPERVLNYVSGPPMKLCPWSRIAASITPDTARAPPLSCRSPAATINARAVLLLGVPSSPTPTGRMRRDAIRASWMRDARVGRSVVVCFLLSALTPEGQLAPMLAEQAEHGDMLFLNAPETSALITSNTRYSGGLKRGRGMPTFKQYARSLAPLPKRGRRLACWPSPPG